MRMWNVIIFGRILLKFCENFSSVKILIFGVNVCWNFAKYLNFKCSNFPNMKIFQPLGLLCSRFMKCFGFSRDSPCEMIFIFVGVELSAKLSEVPITREVSLIIYRKKKNSINWQGLVSTDNFFFPLLSAGKSFLQVLSLNFP